MEDKKSKFLPASELMVWGENRLKTTYFSFSMDIRKPSGLAMIMSDP
jgi:hypothetical protein